MTVAEAIRECGISQPEVRRTVVSSRANVGHCSLPTCTKSQNGLLLSRFGVSRLTSQVEVIVWYANPDELSDSSD
jgi:hypothetical protein